MKRTGGNRVAFAIALLAIALSGCEPPTKDGGIVQEARKAGIDLRADQVVTLSRGDDQIVTAASTAWDRTPATELRNGVDIAFAYVDTSDPDIPAGYYTLRAQADVEAVGTVDGTVQFVDSQGNVAAEVSAVTEVHSLTVADELPFDTSVVVVSPREPGRYEIWYRCPNGVCIRFPFLPPWPIPFPPPVRPDIGLAGALRSAGEAAGTTIVAEQSFSLVRGENAVITAPVAGWEGIPATELRDGVNFGFAYLSAEEFGVPTGYYTLRATANPRGVGVVDARIEFVDSQGEVAGEASAEAEIHSMTVPEQLPFEATVVSLRQIGPDRPTQIWYRCPNGVCIRWPIRFPIPPVIF